MHEQAIRSLEQLAQDDPEVGLLALLYRESVASLDETPGSIESRPIDTTSLRHGIPALDGQQLTIDSKSFLHLFRRMIRVGKFGQFWPGAEKRSGELDLERLVKSLIAWDEDELERIAAEVDAPTAVLVTIGNSAIIPTMVPWQQSILHQASDVPWDSGYCPVCGSWPSLAELRGLEKQLWLRCGRCAAAWRTNHQRCIYCNNADHRTLGYMAADEERESRRVATCQECRGYVKSLATISPLNMGDLLRRDLESLELDLAATDAGYARPEQPGFGVLVEVEVISNAGRAWFPW